MAPTPLGRNLAPKRLPDLRVLPRPQVERHQLGQARPHAVRNIFPGDDQVPARLVPAAKHDVRVRMAGVAMVDRDPVEPGPEILFEPVHQPPGQRFQIIILIAVLGRYDEAELVAIACRPLAERLAVDGIGVAAVKCAPCPIARGAVALEIAQVRGGGRCALAGELDHARLDDDAAPGRSAMATAAGKHPADASAATTSAAGEAAPGKPVSGRSAPRKIGCREHAAEIAPGTLAALAALAPEARLEAVVVGHFPVSGGVEG